MSEVRKVTPYRIRKIILEKSKGANVGHIGSALSVADMIAVLFDGELLRPGTDDPSRDRFVLSKSHAALALCAALHLRAIVTSRAFLKWLYAPSMIPRRPTRHRWLYR